MFSETSHHRNIPFLGKNIPYLEGGPGGGRGVRQKGLNFFTYPGQFLQSRAPLATCPFIAVFADLDPFFTVIFSFENKIKSLVSSRQVL